MSVTKSDGHARVQEPLSAKEQTIAAVWVEVLQVPEVSVTDDFFALGGNSMSMVLAEYRITEELLVELPTGSLLSAPTIRELAALLDSLTDTGKGP